MTMPEQSDHERLADMLPDYLNGHLPASEAARVEAALESSEAMRQQLRFEQRLQHSLRTESTAAEQEPATAGYESIRNRIETESKPFWSWSLPYLGAVAPLALLAVIVLQFDSQPSPEFDAGDINDNQLFETRFDAAQTYSKPTLRILFDEPLAQGELEQWLGETQLELAAPVDTPRRMLEVTLENETAELAVLLQQLRADERIQAVKVMSADE